jgi:hypothetical protein
MFELWTIGIGALISGVMAILKLAAVITLSWWWVSAAILIAVAIVLIKHGLDFTDFLPD